FYTHTHNTSTQNLHTMTNFLQIKVISLFFGCFLPNFSLRVRIGAYRWSTLDLLRNLALPLEERL
ncbi:hypothetical protein, partial [Acetobacter indonesiensis]|uniref:hypothetical protein n=1 Tax=Acetobacter indonesiensis TaxID=104101 RepID=UPI001C4EA959